MAKLDLLAECVTKMTIEDIAVVFNGQSIKLKDAILDSVWENDRALEKLFALIVAFFDSVKNNKLLDLSKEEDFHTFENIVNLAGVAPYIKRGNTNYSLREINPSLVEKIYKLMLSALREYPTYTHKGTPLHNLGSSQFSNQNIDSALIHINEAWRTDFFATSGNMKQIKKRPGFLVLNEDLKRIYGEELKKLIDNYNGDYNKSFTVDSFFSCMNKVKRKGFLLNFFLYHFIQQYYTINKFEQEVFPMHSFKIPENEYLLITRYNCLRNCTIYFEELLRNILGKPRMSTSKLKSLLDSYLQGRKGKLLRVKSQIDKYWSNKDKKKRDTSLASFWSPGYKTRQIDAKVKRILKGNKQLNKSNIGRLSKSLLMTGLIRNYFNHHLDINTQLLKDRKLFETVFQLCFNSIFFIVVSDIL